MSMNWISDLGAANSPLHWVMNGSFVLQGVLISVGAILMRRLFPAKWSYRVALLLFLFSGMGVLVVGLVPADRIAQVHRLAALVHLGAGNLAMILIGLAMVTGAARTRFRGVVTLLAGLLGLTALVLLGLGEKDVGTFERLAAYPLTLWLTWTGFLMFHG
ncbi:MAG: hypothetical protein QOI94_633 [Acidobacteriaceae bacterium]|nr:hypothetical protein [Acidobacteriaceae bacterium]